MWPHAGNAEIFHAYGTSKGRVVTVSDNLLKCCRTKFFWMVANVGEQPLLLLFAAFRGQFFGNLIGNETGTVMRHTVVDRAPGLLHGGEGDPKYGGKILVRSTLQRGKQQALLTGTEAELRRPVDEKGANPRADPGHR